MSNQQLSIIRGSEYQDFLRCRKRWNWRWNEGLKSKKVNDKLFTGTLIHKFLEVLYNKWSLLEAVKAMHALYQEINTEGQDQLQLQEIYQLAYDICEHYWKTWAETDQDHKTIATEMEFMVMLDEGIAFTGTIDYVFQNAEGHIWFMDHKTTSSIDKYEKNSNMDRQISRYWWALKMIAAGVGRVKNKETGNWEKFEPLLDKEIYGFQYNIILKEVPKKPELLKKGGLSKAKNQKTTFELYVQAIADYQLESHLEEYNEILEYLKNQGNRYFKRVDVYRTDAELEAAIYEFFYTAEDIAGLANGLFLVKDPANAQMFQAANHDPRNKLYRNITSDCSWDCEFKALCQAEIEGVNSQFLLASSYEKEGE